MYAFRLILLVCMLATITFISGLAGFSQQINANTPTTAELPATVGNGSTSDLGLTNSTVPVENTTTVTPVSPL
jgi:hypothetical protein